MLHLVTMTSLAIIAKMKDVFIRLGLPKEVVSNNGAQFVSEQFKQVAKNCHHSMSSPHLPNSNDKAESAIKIGKSILRQEDPWLALIIHCDMAAICVPTSDSGCGTWATVPGQIPRDGLTFEIYFFKS